MVKSGTIILNTAARLLMPLQLLFSIFLLLRGHDEPGGGFIAGLVAAGAFTLYLFAFGVSATKEVLRMIDPSLVRRPALPHRPVVGDPRHRLQGLHAADLRYRRLPGRAGGGADHGDDPDGGGQG